jgi:hypothetical protein
MLRHGRVFPRKTTWGARHLRWLQEQKFAHPAHQIALQEMRTCRRGVADDDDEPEEPAPGDDAEVRQPGRHAAFKKREPA